MSTLTADLVDLAFDADSLGAHLAAKPKPAAPAPEPKPEEPDEGDVFVFVVPA